MIANTAELIRGETVVVSGLHKPLFNSFTFLGIRHFREPLRQELSLLHRVVLQLLLTLLRLLLLHCTNLLNLGIVLSLRLVVF